MNEEMCEASVGTLVQCTTRPSPEMESGLDEEFHGKKEQKGG
jgi:hypothetical protein